MYVWVLIYKTNSKLDKRSNGEIINQMTIVPSNGDDDEVQDDDDDDGPISSLATIKGYSIWHFNWNSNCHHRVININ